MPFDNTVLERAEQFNEVMQDAEVNSFWRPDTGQTIICDVVAIHVTNKDFIWKEKDGIPAGAMDGAAVMIEYFYESDPDSEGRKWFGEQIIIPLGTPEEIAGLPEGQKQRIKFGSDRLITRLTALAGYDVEDAFAALQSVCEDLEKLAEAGMPVTASISIVGGKKNTEYANLFNYERILKVLSEV